MIKIFLILTLLFAPLPTLLIFLVNENNKLFKETEDLKATIFAHKILHQTDHKACNTGVTNE